MSKDFIENVPVDGGSAPARRLSVLVVTGTWWPHVVRMAMALADAGCAVSFVCPPGHPVRYVSSTPVVFPLGSLSPVADVVRAIRLTDPDLVVPGDDRMVSMLHGLHQDHAQLRPLIERSLGEPTGYATTCGRAALLQLAARQGLRVPAWHDLSSEEQAAHCFGKFSPVAVVKVDGSYAGEGVRVVWSVGDAVGAYRQMRSGAGLATALKRRLINHDPLWWWSYRQGRRTGPVMQAYVEGVPANTLVACWKGEVLGHVSVETLQSLGATGASMVVRVIANEEMAHAAVVLARELGISGFFGLDFIVERGTGAAWLIELNPRLTQLGHLQLAGQGSLAGLLTGRLMGEMEPPVPSAEGLRPGDVVAFFPKVLPGGVAAEVSREVLYDVPSGEPALVRELMRAGGSWPERQWLARVYNHWILPLIRRSR